MFDVNHLEGRVSDSRNDRRVEEQSRSRAVLEAWAAHLLRQEIDQAGNALAAYCKKPRSAKRLHTVRKQLARLQAALDDLAPLAGVASEFRTRVHEMHRRAGKVRDADVLLRRVESYRHTAGPEECEQLRTIRRMLRKRRKKARRKLERAITSTSPELRP
jgi:CHAD domain-containing protein